MSDPNDLSPIQLIRAKRLAALLGVDPSTIWKWHRDGKLPRKRSVANVSGWLRSDVEHLLTGKAVRR